jgi:hypothetical protein
MRAVARECERIQFFVAVLMWPFGSVDGVDALK